MSVNPALQLLLDEVNECAQTCADNKCARTGCSGNASRAVQAWHADNERQQAEEATYAEFKKLMDRYFKEKGNVPLHTT